LIEWSKHRGIGLFRRDVLEKDFGERVESHSSDQLDPQPYSSFPPSAHFGHDCPKSQV
jgi:hypothetical protein